MAIEPWSPLAKLVNPDGTASEAFIRWSAQLADAQRSQEKQAAAAVVVQQASQESANAAAETAATALEDSTGATTQERSADLSLNVGAGWTNGPTVTFSDAVAVGHVTSGDSGPLYFSQFKTPYLNGEVRLVQIIAAVETVLATESFQAFMEDQSITVSPFAYDAASAATGEVSYRVDARTLGGTIYTLGLRCHIKRAP